MCYHKYNMSRVKRYHSQKCVSRLSFMDVFFDVCILLEI